MTPSAWLSAMAGLGVALGAGLLVGLERESSRSNTPRPGGIRTFALLGMLGGISGLLGPAVGWWAVGLVGALAIAPLVGAALIGFKTGNGAGLTTEVAGMVVHFLGVLATVSLPGLTDTQRWGLVAAASVTTMTALSLRVPLHTLAKKVSVEDLYATAKLGILLLIVLPILPNRPVGGLEWLNPADVGKMVALIAAVGFVGYLLVRFLGSQRGMLLTGLVGGLVSSTAVTLNFAGRTREAPALAPAAALGIVLASTLMFARQLLAVGIVDVALLPRAAIPIGIMGGIGLLAGALGLRRNRKSQREEREGAESEEGGPGKDSEEVEVKNPFSLSQALKFGALYVAVLAVADTAIRFFGETGLYISAFLAGLTDVDAITLTACRLHREQGLGATEAVTTLVIAAGANTLTKGALAASIGGKALGTRVLLIFLPMAAAGGLALLLV